MDLMTQFDTDVLKWLKHVFQYYLNVGLISVLDIILTGNSNYLKRDDEYQ